MAKANIEPLDSVDGYITASMAAEIAGMKRAQFGQYIQRGVIPAKKLGEIILVKVSDVKEYLKKKADKLEHEFNKVKGYQDK